MWTQYLTSSNQHNETNNTSSRSTNCNHHIETTSEHLNQTLYEIRDIIQFQHNELSEIKKTNQIRLDSTKSKVT